MKNDVYVIVRAAGERTQQCCVELIKQQGFTEDQISVVNEFPFAAALKRSYEIGLNHGYTWTFCVDADVLLRSGALHDLYQHACRQPSSVFEIQGMILDKFIGGPRHGGVHVYRTKLLDKALIVLDSVKDNIRPESATLRCMAAKGYPFKKIINISGIHDFEQSFHDIFRKHFVHACKNHYFLSCIVQFCQQQQHIDADYAIALQGLAQGLLHSDKASLDVTNQLYIELFSQCQVVEKEALAANDYSVDRVDQIIACWQDNPAFLELYPERYGIDKGKCVPRCLREELCRKMRATGWVRFPLYALGGGLQRVGNRIISIVQ